MISLADLATSANTLCRSLLSPSPSYAEAALRIDLAVRRQETARAKALVNVWLEVHYGSDEFFIWKGKREGEYRRELRPDVDRSTVVRIEVDAAPGLAVDLIAELVALIDAQS